MNRDELRDKIFYAIEDVNTTMTYDEVIEIVDKILALIPDTSDIEKQALDRGYTMGYEEKTR